MAEAKQLSDEEAELVRKNLADPVPFVGATKQFVNASLTVIEFLIGRVKTLDSALAWCPDMDAAPKDGGPVDLWCIPPGNEEHGRSAHGIRLTNCYWLVKDEHVSETGWWRPTDDGDLDFVEGPPTCQFGLPAWQPTHWRRVPTPPKPEATKGAP